jgi:energy-coupling factor transporter ATP-binding protein EcfA2
LLRGRQKQLDTIEEALASPGKNIFICGDRGVGKTSLAHTAAFIHQPSGKEPVKLCCDANTTFFDIIYSLARTLLANPMSGNSISTTKFKVGIPGVSYEKQTTNDDGKIPAVTDINSTILLLKHLSGGQAVKREEDKVNFANLLKQVGDQRINIQFIFCGIGTSLNDLLGAHGSAHRYIQEVKLERLIYGPRFEIIDASSEAFKVNIAQRMRTRIAAISDGFPHYIHLVCEKLYWELFRDPQPCSDVSLDHYKKAIRSAIESVQQEIQKAYEKATLKDVGDYEEILWAVANHSDLFQHNDRIYDSYQWIMGERRKEPVERSLFSRKLNSLKSLSCGKILVSKTRNWTEFRDTVVRGYVRLQAENQSVELEQDCAPAKVTNENSMRIPLRPIRTKPYTSAPPRRKW